MWLVPSRRPHNLRRLANAWGAAPAWIRLDDDDPMLGGYSFHPGWTVAVGPRKPLCGVYEEAFETYPDLDWYGFLADDVLPEVNWESLIETAGRDGLAFGDDGINGERHAAHFVLGGDLVREVGFLCLPGLSRIYIDTVWCDIARAKGVYRYRPDVKMPHLHFSNGRALMDATYRKPRRDADRALYEAWRNQEKTE